MKATHIMWDIDYDENGYLPTEIEIPEDVVKESEENEDAISDYLSDVTGYCHCGYCLED